MKALDIRKYVFAYRIVGKWSVLPDTSMICTTLNDFKTKIKLQLEPFQPFGHSARTSQTDRTDRIDRQRSYSIGRTVLQTVAQK